MTVCGFNEHTGSGYVRHVRAFAAFLSASATKNLEIGIATCCKLGNISRMSCNRFSADQFFGKAAQKFGFTR